ncbi:clathrin coat assembly protein AP180-like [Salvelinus namaycush]|uniref:Clathrin coat assembly protein AP180-like n=1 Tax=Salvelinus namaycush TaxID=8040 RepID=A0A8U0TK43_SALNM|nr:clathrin coat assembly protein AP180-like [Salvelinus namaycush]
MVWFGLVWFYPSDSTGGETKPAAPAAASGAELMAAFDGLGDVLMPSMTPQAGAASSPVKSMGGDLDATMASMASNLGMGSQKPGENTMGGWSTPQVAPPSRGAPMGGAVGAGAPMMPMVRPGFGAPATPGAPMGSPGMAGSPRRPPPPKNALDDLNIKDFM